MNNDPVPGGKRAFRLLTYVRAYDAQTFIVGTELSDCEAADLNKVLDRLSDLGVITLRDSETRLSQASGIEEVTELLRQDLGALMVDSAVGAARFPFTPTPPLQSLLPLWPFEPAANGSGVLIGHGLLFGAPIDFHALRVEDDDLIEPLSGVADRFHAWRSALGSGTMLGTASVPGAEGSYVVFAALQAG